MRRRRPEPDGGFRINMAVWSEYVTSHGWTGSMTAMAASEFKAKCLDLMDRVGRREMEALSITKHGRVVAMLAERHGFMRHSVVGAADIDLTAPSLDEDFAAAEGHLHL